MSADYIRGLKELAGPSGPVGFVLDDAVLTQLTACAFYDALGHQSQWENLAEEERERYLRVARAVVGRTAQYCATVADARDPYDDASPGAAIRARFAIGGQ